MNIKKFRSFILIFSLMIFSWGIGFITPSSNLKKNNNSYERIISNLNIEIETLNNKIINFKQKTTNETTLNNEDLKGLKPQISTKRISKEVELEENDDINQLSTATILTGNNTFDERTVINEANLYKQNLNSRFSSEVIDIDWDNKISKKFDSFLEDNYLFDTKLIYKDCKTTICRIEFSHENVQAINIFNKKLQEYFDFPGGADLSSSSDENGKIKTTLYIKRVMGNY